MNKCNQCNKATEEITEYSYIINKFPFMFSICEITVGRSIKQLCPECKVKADIELREFLKSSKYYLEIEPF